MAEEEESKRKKEEMVNSFMKVNLQTHIHVLHVLKMLTQYLFTAQTDERRESL